MAASVEAMTEIVRRFIGVAKLVSALVHEALDDGNPEGFLAARTGYPSDPSLRALICGLSAFSRRIMLSTSTSTTSGHFFSSRQPPRSVR